MTIQERVNCFVFICYLSVDVECNEVQYGD